MVQFWDEQTVMTQSERLLIITFATSASLFQEKFWNPSLLKRRH